MKTTSILNPNVITGTLYAGAILFMAAGASAQNLFVSTYGSGAIYQVTPGGSPSVFASGQNFPAGIAFNSAGDLFIGNSANNNGESGNITEIMPGGATSVFYSGLDPDGLAFNNNTGNLFEADYRNNTIYEYTSAGTQSTFATGLSGPLSLAFDKSGNLFVGNSDGSIEEFAPGGTHSIFATGLGLPNGMAFNNAGTLFVGNELSGVISEFTTGGAGSTFVTLPIGVNGLAFDNAGDLYAAAGTGAIYEVTPAKVQSTFVTIPGGGGDELAFNPVPEPSTLALLAAGASVVTLRLRRKNNSAC